MKDVFDSYSDPCPECGMNEREFETNIGIIFCKCCGLDLGTMPQEERFESVQIPESSPAGMPTFTKGEIRAWNKANPHERSWVPRERQIRFIGNIDIPLNHHSVLSSCKELYKTLSSFNAMKHDNSLRNKYGTWMKIAVDSDILYEEENQGMKPLQQKQFEGYRRPTSQNVRSIQDMAKRLRLLSSEAISPCGEFISEDKDHLMLAYICEFNRSLNRLFAGEHRHHPPLREEAIETARKQFKKCWDVACHTLEQDQDETMSSARDAMFELLVSDDRYPLVSSALGQLGCQLESIYRYMKYVLGLKMTAQTLVDSMNSIHGCRAKIPSPAQKNLAKMVQEAMNDDG